MSSSTPRPPNPGHRRSGGCASGSRSPAPGSTIGAVARSRPPQPAGRCSPSESGTTSPLRTAPTGTVASTPTWPPKAPSARRNWCVRSCARSSWCRVSRGRSVSPRSPMPRPWRPSRIWSSGTSPLIGPGPSSSAISPTSTPGRASCTWPRSSTATRRRSSAGRSMTTCAPSWSRPHWPTRPNPRSSSPVPSGTRTAVPRADSTGRRNTS